MKMKKYSLIKGEDLTPRDIINTVKWLEKYRDKIGSEEASEAWERILNGEFIPLFCAIDGVLSGLICLTVSGDVAEISVCCGSGFLDVFEYEKLVDWDAIGVKKLKFSGRPAWQKKGKEAGWNLTKIDMEKNVGRSIR